MQKLPPKKFKQIQNIDNEEISPNVVYSLNDGRVAIGGAYKLLIYNMKTYKIDIKIEGLFNITYIYQFIDNKLYYYSNYSCGLIELSDKDFILKKEEIFPKNAIYSKIKEIYNGKILFGGISYYYKDVEPRLDILKKVNNNKYEVISYLNYNIFKDFALLKNKIIATLTDDYLYFNNIKTLKNIKKISVNNYRYIHVYNNKFLLIGDCNEFLIYNYINYRKVQYIISFVGISKIYIINNIAYIIDRKYKISDCIIEDNGNFKKIHYWSNTDTKDITQLKDGTMITISPLTIWY